MTTALAIGGFWLACVAALWLWQGTLLRRTWREPYLADNAVLIESDDWGPGGDFHANRLRDLAALLDRHQDSSGRSAVLTADMVLAVPDTAAIRAESYKSYLRSALDTEFEPVYSALQETIATGVVVPQLHGMEHLYGNGLVTLAAAGDSRVQAAFATDHWWDWESLDSPLQGHYVDGTVLPTQPLSAAVQAALVNEACTTFERLFGFRSRSTVAPCYLWGDDTERAWSDEDIDYVQTAGYRCTGRDAAGHYHQDPPVLRAGDRNTLGQTYLVRNAMYEPVDGRGAGPCWQQCVAASRQATPIVISTHRYNYTRSAEEHRDSLAGLGQLLTQLPGLAGDLRFLSSPELGAWMSGKPEPLRNPANGQQWPTLRQAGLLTRLRGFL